MTRPRARAAAVLGCFALMALGLSACENRPAAGLAKPPVATSAENAGGMRALIAAAKREGTLRTIALPRDWADYGGLIDGFGKKYGIKVTVEDPLGHSEDEIDALKRRGNRPTAPDVIDVGDAFARNAAAQNLLAPYKVAAYDSIPDNQKDPKARWSNNYGGYISIGCDANRVKPCPETFADLLKPAYKGKVSLEGEPPRSATAFSSVYAAALANNGSFDDIQPGLDFFAELEKNGNLNPLSSNLPTVQDGRTPISINWDYINLHYADQLRDKGVNWQVAIPFDGSFAQYFALAINKNAPHPAAARLWQEYLFSPEGQNLRLRGYARPVLMDAMQQDGTLDKAAAARLPTVEGTPQFPTDAQLEKARETVARGWAKAVSG
ncbi:putative spermidine/putrescine transport system substrate-binding protein [Streptomyces griseochromogenes]|uniref:Spermidine/putrescine transport system substrate-binding protein n=2 Tax=Streptomyces griseochromogenes TaxID=68214 RepID=A0ABS4LJZ6_9ACTN|nr:putative spermidine/putrescine transport system substrate-binding protein [Streptomyces griseochromogenes]